jgi:hypothetical protein
MNHTFIPKFRSGLIIMDAQKEKDVISCISPIEELLDSLNPTGILTKHFSTFEVFKIFIISSAMGKAAFPNPNTMSQIIFEYCIQQVTI